MSMSVSTNTTSHPVVDPCQAEALLKATTEFIAHISAANDTQVLANNSSHKLALAKPIFRRLKLWERSYNTAAYPLDRVLSCAPIQAETILLLLCHFVIIVVEEFGTCEYLLNNI